MASKKGSELTQWVGQIVQYREGTLAKKEVLLMLMVVDDSSSIEEKKNTRFVVDGYQWFLDGLKKATTDVRVGTLFLNTELPIKFVPAANAPNLRQLGYRPHNNTPLFKRSMDGLQALTQEVQRLTAKGYIVRTMTFIFTDGCDNESKPLRAEHLFPIITTMTSTKMHIVGGCGVWDGCTNFREVFAQMGIQEQWIKVLSEGREIQDTFEEMGESTSLASQDAQSFETVSKTGFGSSSDSSLSDSSSSKKRKPKP